jgi:hypothetical protein
MSENMVLQKYKAISFIPLTLMYFILANNLGDDGEKREEVKANVIEKNKQKRK